MLLFVSVFVSAVKGVVSKFNANGYEKINEIIEKINGWVEKVAKLRKQREKQKPYKALRFVRNTKKTITTECR